MWNVYLLILGSVVGQSLGCSWWIMGCICKKYTNYSIRTSCTAVRFDDTTFEQFSNTSITGTSNFYTYLHTLNLTDTKLSSIQPGALSKYRNLKNLYLNKNNLFSLEPHMFNDLRTLRNLDVSNNSITTLNDSLVNTFISVLIMENNELTEVINNTLPTNLTLLNLAHNKISTLEEISLQYLLKLNLSYNDLEALKGNILKLPTLQDLDLSNNKLKNVDIEAFKDLADIKIINLSYNKLTKLDMFPPINLNVLNVSHNEIRNIDDSTFKDLTVLLDLDLNNNKLTTVNSKAFGYLKNLTKLDLASNEISYIKANTFESLSSLVYLNLYNNKLSSLESKAFNLVALQYLNLSRNSINNIEIGAIGNMSELTNLNLHGNNITELKTNTLTALPSLVMLNLSENNIQSIQKFAFSDLKSILIIDISRNKIRKLENNIFNHLESLQTLNISFNELNDVVDDLEGVKSIVNLDLSNNQLTSVSHFKNFNNLGVLNMSYNAIESLSKDTFDDNLVNMKELILKHNFINDIPTACFGHLHNLKVLDLSENRISNLNISNTVGLKSLSRLYVQSNMIKNISAHTFHNLPNLFMLDVSKNRLQSLNLSETTDIRMININENLFPCSELSTLINYFKRRHVALVAGTEKDEMSIRGVFCVETYQDFRGINHEKSYVEPLSTYDGLEKKLTTISTLLVIIVLIVCAQIAVKLVIQYKGYFMKPRHYQSQRSDLESML